MSLMIPQKETFQDRVSEFRPFVVKLEARISVERSCPHPDIDLVQRLEQERGIHKNMLALAQEREQHGCQTRTNAV